MYAKGDRAAAEPLLREALEVKRETLGSRHPSMIGSINNLGLVLLAKGDLAAAEPIDLCRPGPVDPVEPEPVVVKPYNWSITVAPAYKPPTEWGGLFREAVQLQPAPGKSHSRWVRSRFMQAARRAWARSAPSSMMFSIVEGDEDELMIDARKHSWRGTYGRVLRLSSSGLETLTPDATRRVTNVWRLSQIQIVPEPISPSTEDGRALITLCVAQQHPVPWRQELSFSVGSAEERAILIEQLSVLHMRAAA